MIPTASIEPRLLGRKQAAAYCGMCPVTFERTCPVQPVDVGLRTYLYDRRGLDRWIDSLNGSTPAKRDWLAALDDGHIHAAERN